MKTTIHLYLHVETGNISLIITMQGLLQSAKAMGENPLAGTGLSVVDKWFIHELLVIEYPWKVVHPCFKGSWIKISNIFHMTNNMLITSLVWYANYIISKWISSHEFWCDVLKKCDLLCCITQSSGFIDKQWKLIPQGNIHISSLCWLCQLRQKHCLTRTVIVWPYDIHGIDSINLPGLSPWNDRPYYIYSYPD